MLSKICYPLNEWLTHFVIKIRWQLNVKWRINHSLVDGELDNKFWTGIFRKCSKLTITANGEAYIIMLPTMHMLPTMAERSLIEWTKVRTRRAKTAMNRHSAATINSNLSLFFLSEYIRKSNKYITSITNPEPFMVTTSVLCGCTIGSPYRTHSPQFTKVARYGTGEYCSTDFFFHIR